MGMAASQARLLTITSRLHDVEYQAQSIQNAKIQLSTQSDEVYQNYLDALDATTLTIKDDSGNTITANFNNLCGMNTANTANHYAILDDRGRLVVQDDIASAYKDFQKQQGDNDPYTFAVWMMGNSENPDTLKDELSIVEDKVASGTTNLSTKREELNKIIDEAFKSVYGEDYNKDGADNYDLNRDGLLNAITDETSNNEESKVKILKSALEKYDSLESSYRYKLYQQSAKEIFTSNNSNGDAIGDEIDFDQDEFNYYVRIYNEIQQAGGCVGISSFDGPLSGDAANDSDWLQQQLENGKFSISSVITNNKTGEVSLNTTSPSTDTYVGYTTTTTIDKTAYAKAEAEYEHATKEIDKKDKKYDNELSKLETERTALTTEYDSVKKVISDNVERTFGIFS